MISVCPAYASEIAPPTFRGRIGGLYSYDLLLLQSIAIMLGLGFSVS